MKFKTVRLLLLLSSSLFFYGLIFTASAQTDDNQFIFGDALPDAPELSARGTYKVGVRTLEFVNKGQIDILKRKDNIDPVYDRPLKVEVWYPAILPDGAKELVTYDQVMGAANNPQRPLIPYTFQGRASRDAAPLTAEGAFPLIVVSHGYLGSRLLLTYLTENLASKGYIVVAIDHTESTYRDAGGFPSTLLNRPKDILFILNQIADLGKTKSKNFLSGIVDAENTALIGYSMGGYGVLNVAGAGYSQTLLSTFESLTSGSKAVEVRTTNHPDFKASYDPRIKAVVAFAPWGMQRGTWDAEGLKGLKVPVFFVAGSQDDVSGYADGIKAIYSGAVNSDRYLLTYINARHNVAPNPPPYQALKPGLPLQEYYHYAEPAWNEKKINNINQHFVTAFLGIHLKKKDFGKFLELNENSNDKNWTGFKPRSSVGMELLHAVPQK
ncbi:Alpha/beta hydrolase family protein [Pseudarcicella hirudinis]|uniref:Alpha/beta hydrolase family protein n=1 Tax=Pseudarcicella hirudinis TaxID=1079859 RepID=A0A1I5NMZ4_9BACT|nr:dienelactone hydrolase [Pseudarcicella hirudinis]SFP23185.1 Alpha/beta hydrolase family protein [Pseudarcicella hirudinis]